MPQEDKFKREIDRIGLVLAKLLDLLLGGKQFDDDEATHFAQQCRLALNIDLDEFLEMNKGDDLDYLVKYHKFSNENLRNFGHLLYDLAHKTIDEEKRKALLQKALNVYQHITANSQGTLYLDVAYRLKELQ